MIELRWVDRYKIRDPKISGYQGERETVLQIRDARWDMLDRATGKEVYTGTAWKDVPTVREE